MKGRSSLMPVVGTISIAVIAAHWVLVPDVVGQTTSGRQGGTRQERRNDNESLPENGSPSEISARTREVVWAHSGITQQDEAGSITVHIFYSSSEDDGTWRHLATLPRLNHLVLRDATDQSIEHAAHLPGLANLTLYGSGVTDAGLARVARMTQLKGFGSANASVTDAGLKHLEGLKQLSSLALVGSPISDEGLKHVAKLTGLKVLYLDETKVTNAGLEHLRPLSDLQWIGAEKTAVTAEGITSLGKYLDKFDTGMSLLLSRGVFVNRTPQGLRCAHLRGDSVSNEQWDLLRSTTKLGELRLAFPKLTDDDLTKLAGMSWLKSLYIENADITDDGLASLGRLADLRHLTITRCDVSDAGLKHLAGLKSVRSVDFSSTRVTLDGIRKLAEACPELDMPTSAALFLPGFSKLDSEFRIAELNLRESQSLRDSDLLVLSGSRSLRRINLNRTGITDTAAEALAKIPSLQDIRLSRTGITGESLVHLAKLNQLRSLDLSQTNVNGADFALLGRSGALRDLDLSRCDLDERTIKSISTIQSLRRLSINRARLTDSAVAALASSLPNLATLETAIDQMPPAHLVALNKRFRLDSFQLPDVAPRNIVYYPRGSVRPTLKYSRANADVLAQLRAKNELGAADIEGPELTDAALRQLAGMSQLRRLTLGPGPYTGDGLAVVAKLPRLKELWIRSQSVNDDALNSISGSTSLERLRLRGPITDAGIRRLKRATNLTSLELTDTHIQGAGLADLRDLKNLESVRLYSSDVDDEALRSIGQLTQLRFLNLDKSSITDGGLRHLVSLQKLERLSVNDTAVSAKALGSLSEMLPKLPIKYIQWRSLGATVTTSRERIPDGIGALEVKGEAIRSRADDLRRLAQLERMTIRDTRGEDLLALEGLYSSKRFRILTINGGVVTARGLKSISGLGSLKYLTLSDVTIEEAGLVELARLESLTTLNLSGSDISDDGLKAIAAIASLQTLILNRTLVSTKGISHLVTMKKLEHLDLSEVAAKDEALQHLGKITSLRELKLAKTFITSAGLKHLQPLQNLSRLDLSSTRIDDEGTQSLSNLKDLRVLGLRSTQVGDATLVHVGKLTKLWQLDLGATKITDAGLKELKDLYQLKRLTCDRCENVTDDGLKSLQRILPQLSTRTY